LKGRRRGRPAQAGGDEFKDGKLDFETGRDEFQGVGLDFEGG
jgi:hypothetical protein